MLVIEGCSAPENIMQVLELILDELGKLISADEPVNEEELWKAKMQIRGQHLISGENTDTRMSRLASQELYFDRHLPDEDILAEIDEIGVPKLQFLANEVLQEGVRRAAVAVVGPDVPDHYEFSSIKRLFGDH
jgi:predicted Zn-dependent peptidase